MTFEFLRDGGGGAFFNQENKNQFLKSTQFMTLLCSTSGGITFSQNLPKLYHIQHTHAADTWTTTRHSFSVMNCNVNTRS